MRCAKCGAKRREGSGYSPLGEPVCATCQDAIVGVTMGMLGGGGIGAAVAGPGILRWMREAFHPEQRLGRLARRRHAPPTTTADPVAREDVEPS